jgi:hypothetical protein
MYGCIHWSGDLCPYVLADTRALHGAGGREATVEHVLGTRGYSRGTARVLECAAAAARPQQPTRTHIYTRVTPTAARTCAGGRTGV